MSDLLRESAEHEARADEYFYYAKEEQAADRPQGRVNHLMLRAIYAQNAAIYAQNAAILRLLRGNAGGGS